MLLYSLLMMVCLLGCDTLQTMMVVSREPLATIAESGDQATVLTRAVWNPHSLLWASLTKDTLHLNHFRTVMITRLLEERTRNNISQNGTFQVHMHMKYLNEKMKTCKIEKEKDSNFSE